MTSSSHIGQYRIIRKLGEGGMGTVWLAEHVLLGRRAAIKTLLSTLSARQEIVDRFFNEARATAAISDPGVVQIFDFGYHVDGTAYIVMELLEGEALSARIDRLGTLPVAHALRIMRQSAGGLAAAHANGIIHRDLKPENIFLGQDAEMVDGERAKILDFGICKLEQNDAHATQTGTIVGTPVYMSPEQCRGLGDVDARSDLYSLGCVLFHMLTGRTPFECTGSGEFIVAHMHEAPPAPSSVRADIPPEVDALLLRCLAKSPDDRFQSMADLQAAIDPILGELEQSVAEVVAAPAKMSQLGTGFRSAFDANVVQRPASKASLASKVRTPYQRPPHLVVTATPITLAPSNAPAWKAIRRAAVALALIGTVIAGVVLVRDANEAIAHAQPATTRLEGDTVVSQVATETPTPAPAFVPVPVPVVTVLTVERPALEPKPIAAKSATKQSRPAATRPRPVRATPTTIAPKPTPTEDLYDTR